MRVLLISANTEKINILPMPLGLHYVAAATRNRGHDVRVLDLMTHEESARPIRNAIGSFHPDVIGVSVRNIDDQDMNDPKFLLAEVKSTVLRCRRLSDAPIVLGVPVTASFPRPFSPTWGRRWASRERGNSFSRNCWKGWRRVRGFRDCPVYI
jgi:hypothetical protein